MKAYRCFPSLEEFARHLGNENSTTNNSNCTKTARVAIHGERKIIPHMWANYQKMAATIPVSGQVYVIRTEHLWDDWYQINKLLDPTRNVYIPHDLHGRYVKNLTLPVTKDISTQGREYICKHLNEEYRVYYSLLERAVNINKTDMQDARDAARRNCPNV
jgi:hypothetical protein